jgi:hypothetical protein
LIVVSFGFFEQLEDKKTNKKKNKTGQYACVRVCAKDMGKKTTSV